jgi:putative ABC transport system permease protein
MVENMTGNAVPSSKKAIAKQIVLPFSKSLEISYKSLKIRFFRSMITVSSLILAVSFLSFVLVNTDVANGLLQGDGGTESVEMLYKAGYDVDAATGRVGSSAKERWIVALSLLVCAVGIVNAQLMAVTERFREIGVMKCLGALDRFVLRLFLLEAGMQGLAGAGIGALFGALVGLLTGVVRFGFAAFSHLSGVDVLISVSLATLAGFVLSLLGVLYPAILAARMRPVMALRAEH